MSVIQNVFSCDAFPHIILTDAAARLWTGMSHFAQVSFPLSFVRSRMSHIPGPLGGRASSPLTPVPAGLRCPGLTPSGLVLAYSLGLGPGLLPWAGGPSAWDVSLCFPFTGF